MVYKQYKNWTGAILPLNLRQNQVYRIIHSSYDQTCHFMHPAYLQAGERYVSFYWLVGKSVLFHFSFIPRLFECWVSPCFRQVMFCSVWVKWQDTEDRESGRTVSCWQRYLMVIKVSAYLKQSFNITVILGTSS